MFGCNTYEQHPKADVILKAVQDYTKFPRRLTNLKILSAAPSVSTPRFGGRTIFLWVKGKTRVWIDKSNVWISTSSFPSTFLSGSLFQAEIFNVPELSSPSGKVHSIIAFEDILMFDAKPQNIIPFNQRQVLLNLCISDLKACSDYSRDPGIYSVKPWFQTKSLLNSFAEYHWVRIPEWLYIITKDGTTFFTKFINDIPDSHSLIKDVKDSATKAGTEGSVSRDNSYLKPSVPLTNNDSSHIEHQPEVIPSHIKENNQRQSANNERRRGTENSEYILRRIYRIEDDDPDQYELRPDISDLDMNVTDNVEALRNECRACVRTLWASKWLRTIKDGTLVVCRRINGFENLEPYTIYTGGLQSSIPLKENNIFE
jgi:hypothetical protein